MDDVVCIIRDWISSFAVSSNFYELFFGAFFGTLFAFIFAWSKDYLSSKLRQNTTLVETRFALEKYLLHIKDTQNQIRNLRDYSLNRINPRLRALRYGKFFMLSIFLNIETNKLLFLVKKNKHLLNSILLATHQYEKIFLLHNQRNEQLELLNISRLSMAQLFEQTIIAEKRIYPFTVELLKTLWKAREDCKKALRGINSYL